MRGSVLWSWLTTALGARLAFAVRDVAKDAAPHHTAFVLFKGSNMKDADKLPDGMSIHSFKVPAVVMTTTGRMLAFAEARRFDNRNFGDIRIVLKRTKETNMTGDAPQDWESIRVVVEKAGGAWSNPTPVVDGQTIYLFLNWNNGGYSQSGFEKLPNGKTTKKINKSPEGRRHLFLTKSTDDGQTWSEPKSMTEQLTPDLWDWDAVGPGSGIVTSSGDVVVPAMGRNIIGRGDEGHRVWAYQKLKGAGVEGTIIQTSDGSLYRNDRGDNKYRYRRVSRGNLDSFARFTIDKNLPDPGCAGATILYNRAFPRDPARVVFLNSADETSRRAMRVQISYDEKVHRYHIGRNFSDAPVFEAGVEGGSASLTRTADSHLGALVETDFEQTGGSKDDSGAILWRKFNLSWILHGVQN